MKILSVIFTVALLVLASRLACDLAKADCLPGFNRSTNIPHPAGVP